MTQGETMQQYTIMIAVGRDRPGLVDMVSTYLFERGANIEDSRMAAMGGCFGIMTLFSCSDEGLAKIRAELDGLRAEGLEVSLHEASDPAGLPQEAHLPLALEVTAMDHPGIVKKAVRVLHRHGVNIVSLNTRVSRAPLSGAPLFDLKLEAAVPPDRSLAKIKDELAALAAELNLDLNFSR